MAAAFPPVSYDLTDGVWVVEVATVESLALAISTHPCLGPDLRRRLSAAYVILIAMTNLSGRCVGHQFF